MKPNSRRRFSAAPYLFIAPQLILFTVFFIIPAAMGIFTAFSKWNVYNQPWPIFNGLENFKQIFTDSSSTYYGDFRTGMKNTCLFVLMSVPFCILVPLLMAVVLSLKPRGHKFYQALFYLPNILSISTVILIWFYFFNRSEGFLNNFFGASVNWLGEQPFAWIAITVITVWWCLGGNLVIYVAAINGVSRDMLEAADVDGASLVTRFTKIVLPSIRPQLGYTLVLTTISQFGIYGQSLMLTSGGPNRSTHTIMMFIRSIAFGTFGTSVAGVAAAMALMIGMVMIVTSFVLNKLTAERD